MTLYLSLNELCPERKLELKQAYLHYHGGKEYAVSYKELADADELVTEEMLQEEFGNTDFCEDDFFWKPNERGDTI